MKAGSCDVPFVTFDFVFSACRMEIIAALAAWPDPAYFGWVPGLYHGSCNSANQVGLLFFCFDDHSARVQYGSAIMPVRHG